jgi:hypothetical protein
LKGAPLSVLVALEAVGKVASQRWLERVTGYSKRTVHLALVYLQEIGLAERPGWEKWRKVQTSWSVLVKPDAERDKFYTFSAEEEEGLNINNNQEEDINPPPPPPERDKFYDSLEEKSEQMALERLLRAAGVPAVEVEAVLDDPEISLQDALAEVAYCHTPANRVRRPDRLIGRNLLQGHQPSAEYYEAPEKAIPLPILVKAGLVEADQPDEQENETESLSDDEDDQTPQDAQPEPDASVFIPFPGSELTPQQAWERVLQTLRDEIPLHVYEQKLKPARLHAYQDKTLVLIAASEYDRDWLTERMTKLLERTLVGITNGCVKGVRFIWQEPPGLKQPENGAAGEESLDVATGCPPDG